MPEGGSGAATFSKLPEAVAPKLEAKEVFSWSTTFRCK